MFKIVKAEQLSASVYMKVVEAPRVAKACEPGQFIIVRLDADSGAHSADHLRL